MRGTSGGPMPNCTGKTEEPLKPIIIRELVPADVPAILEIQRAAREVAQWAGADYQSMTHERSGLVLVAKYGEAGAPRAFTAGFVAARSIGVEAELQNLAVRAEYRRHGVARALVEELHCRLAAAGVNRVYLEVRVSNLPARTLYRSLGYAECGLRRGYYASDGEDALVFELRLDHSTRTPATATETNGGSSRPEDAGPGCRPGTPSCT